VFLNLLLNARDAMPDGGRIRIGARRAGTWAVVTVADEGHGIPQDALARVFEPFFTTKGDRGSGLGLSIAAGVMRRLGGTISAGNGDPRGAVITLQFPLASAAAAEPAAPPASAEAPRRPARVLLVDDDADNLEVTRIVLEEMGHQVAAAPGGAEALARVIDGDRFDVVLCDLGMPGLTGWDVAEQLRDVVPALPIYLVTGWSEQIPAEEPRRARVSGILPKPLDVDQLAAVIARVVQADLREAT
jgi:CheY-like chemotaxis protein